MDILYLNSRDIETLALTDAEIIGAIEEAKRSESPSVIIMNTVKGKGVSFMENQAGFHGRACKPEEYEQAVRELKEALE